MHKIMSLDIGTKRIGVALSDYLHLIANGECCISRIPEKKAVEDIKNIAKQNNVNTIVVGIPINMDGTYGHQSEDCKNFAGNFPEFDIKFEDERLTSDLAEEILREKRIDFRKNKGLVDIESARIILEQYLAKL